MSFSRPLPFLARSLGVFGIFAAGVTAHWVYSNARTGNSPGPGTTVNQSAKPDAAPGFNATQLAEPGSAPWRAVDPADRKLTLEFLKKREEKELRRRAERQLAAMAGGVELPAVPVFPRHVGNPDPAIGKAVAPVAVSATGSGLPKDIEKPGVLAQGVLAQGVLAQGVLAQGVLAQGVLANVEKAINRSAAIDAPAALDLKGLALAAMRTQILKTELSMRVLETRLTRKLRKEHARVLVMAAREINRIAKPGPPASLAGLNSVVLARTMAGSNGLGAIAQATGAGGKTEKVRDTAVGRKVTAYARLPEGNAVSGSRTDTEGGVKAPATAAEAFDLTGVREAIVDYRKGNMTSGDAHAKRATNDVTRVAIEWAALKLQPRKAGFSRIQAFLNEHPNWPRRSWLQWRAEQSLYIDSSARKHVAAYLAAEKPVSPIGKLVAVRHLLSKGDERAAKELLVQVWRHEKFNGWLEKLIVKEFGKYLTLADYKYRSDRHFYKERYSASIRVAGKAGKDIYAFAAARAAVARGASPAKLGVKFSSKYRKDPSWYFAQAQRLRRAKKPKEAASLLLASHKLGGDVVDAASWWAERRMVARRILDDGDPKTAYAVSANHKVREGAAFIDAEFYSGWIALRFLNKPQQAQEHFARALEKSTRPLSRSRAAYWQARAAERGSRPEQAEQLYATAAKHSSTYYGQLARARIMGVNDIPVRRSGILAAGAARLMAVRVVDVLKRVDEDTLSLRLAIGLAQHCNDEAQIAALAAIMRREQDARGSLIIGKLASYRGIELDDIAFPDFGIPQYVSLSNSADKSVVYAIARQESAFRAKAVSHAGAKGLMQMLTSTARRTAKRKGIPFSPDRLVSDPAFNAQLGAAHLGELMDEHPGSMILVFAAYNAGGPRVNQWIRTYGDPRKEGVDPIDWVERIPIAETRNYVQRVTENFGVYRSVLGRQSIPHQPMRDLRAYASRM